MGWFGHKAIVRIQAWGLNMNTQDRIFQDTFPENHMEFRKDRKPPAANSGPVALGSHHLPLGAVSLK